MYRVIFQEQGSLEIGVDGDLTRDDFKQIVHQLESLCTTYREINVVFDLINMGKYDPRIAIEEYEFYKKYKDYLKRVAVVSESRTYEYFVKLFGRFSGLEIRMFKPDELEQARAWGFPSKLPRPDAPQPGR